MSDHEQRHAGVANQEVQEGSPTPAQAVVNGFVLAPGQQETAGIGGPMATSAAVNGSDPPLVTAVGGSNAGGTALNESDRPSGERKRSSGTPSRVSGNGSVSISPETLTAASNAAYASRRTGAPSWAHVDLASGEIQMPNLGESENVLFQVANTGARSKDNNRRGQDGSVASGDGSLRSSGVKSRNSKESAEVSTASIKGKPEQERLQGGNDGEKTPTSVRSTRERGGAQSPYVSVNGFLVDRKTGLPKRKNANWEPFYDDSVLELPPELKSFLFHSESPEIKVVVSTKPLESRISRSYSSLERGIVRRVEQLETLVPNKRSSRREIYDALTDIYFDIEAVFSRFCYLTNPQRTPHENFEDVNQKWLLLRRRLDKVLLEAWKFMGGVLDWNYNYWSLATKAKPNDNFTISSWCSVMPKQGVEVDPSLLIPNLQKMVPRLERLIAELDEHSMNVGIVQSEINSQNMDARIQVDQMQLPIEVSKEYLQNLRVTGGCTPQFVTVLSRELQNVEGLCERFYSTLVDAQRVWFELGWSVRNFERGRWGGNPSEVVPLHYDRVESVNREIRMLAARSRLATGSPLPVPSEQVVTQTEQRNPDVCLRQKLVDAAVKPVTERQAAVVVTPVARPKTSGVVQPSQPADALRRVIEDQKELESQVQKTLVKAQNVASSSSNEFASLGARCFAPGNPILPGDREPSNPIPPGGKKVDNPEPPGDRETEGISPFVEELHAQQSAVVRAEGSGQGLFTTTAVGGIRVSPSRLAAVSYPRSFGHPEARRAEIFEAEVQREQGFAVARSEQLCMQGELGRTHASARRRKKGGSPSSSHRSSVIGGTIHYI